MNKYREYQPHAANAFIADDMLPCPCCGGDPELLFVGNPWTKSRKVTIKCKKCRLQRTDATISNNAEWVAKVAIEQWNERGYCKRLEHKLSDAEKEIEKWKNTDYTDLEIDLANKDKEIQTLVELLEECLPIIKDSCLYGMLELEYRIAKTLKKYE